MAASAPEPDAIDAARRLVARANVHRSWANTKDRTARTAPGRAAMQQKFLDEAGGDPVKAEHLRKAFYADMARKGLLARRRKSEERRRAQEKR